MAAEGPPSTGVGRGLWEGAGDPGSIKWDPDEPISGSHVLGYCELHVLAVRV